MQIVIDITDSFYDKLIHMDSNNDSGYNCENWIP